MKQAKEKGLTAILINEDNSKDKAVWSAIAKGLFQLVYISPEMALSARFRQLLTNKKFAKRLGAVFVDEVHCVHEWGEGFRPMYQQLDTLRVYTGYEIPVVACSATLPTETFNVVWQKLAFGNRPFFGVDTGTDRHNLLYLIRPVEHPDNPALDILQVLPEGLTNESTAADIKQKVLFYIQNETACRDAVQTIRKCLPEHLRSLVYAYSSDLSTEGKDLIWERFHRGEIKILCCTDAAGMGCNEPDVDLTAVAGDPKSISAVAQRWGRAARGRTHQGTCLLLAPKWAFRPPDPGVEADEETGTEKPKKPKPERKQWQVNRSKMQKELVDVCNLGSSSTGTTEGELPSKPELAT